MKRLLMIHVALLCVVGCGSKAGDSPTVTAAESRKDPAVTQPAPTTRRQEDIDRERNQKVAALCTSLTDPDPGVRQKALASLEKLAPELHGPLVTLVTDKNQEHQIDASIRLAFLGEAAAPVVPLLRKHLEWAVQSHLKGAKPTPLPIGPPGFRYFDVQYHTLITLAPDKKTEETISQVFRTKPEEYQNSGNDLLVKWRAVMALSDMGLQNPEFRPSIAVILANYLKEGLADPRTGSGNEQIRIIELLQGFGTGARSALPVLKPLKTHPTPMIRSAAINALKVIE